MCLDLTLKTFKSLFVPGGILLVCALIAAEIGFVRFSVTAIQTYYYAVFFAGILLAWRFHSSRILFALITLLLAYRAMEFFSSGRAASFGPGRVALETAAFLIPLNFIFVSFIREWGFALASLASRIGLLFFESVLIAVLCRPGQFIGPAMVHRNASQWNNLPQLALLAFSVTFVVLLAKFLIYRKPLEAGLLWSAGAAFFGLQAGAVNKIGMVYFGTAGLILVSSIIENTYALAYQDELTGVPSRRAFNDALLRLTEPYSIAVVDIDHFKSFNDTYGHETGDQVLRLVAGKLAAVGAGGRAYRVGGEEFSILFPGKSMNDVVEHLESLRATIERSTFYLRSAPERRAEPRGPDRRTPTAQKKTLKKATRFPKKPENELSVTVSIGVAEPSSKTRDAEQVIHLADKALYRAKHAGRNRVETYRATRSRAARGAGRSIAS